MPLPQVEAVLQERQSAFPHVVKADLDDDQRSKAGMILHEYNLEAAP